MQQGDMTGRSLAVERQCEAFIYACGTCPVLSPWYEQAGAKPDKVDPVVNRFLDPVKECFSIGR